MRLVLSEFISLDGVIQAPGGKKEDTSGGFQHGGWSMRYFDVDSMGSFIDHEMQQTDAYIFGRKTWQVSAAAWPERGGDPFADKLNSEAALPGRRATPWPGARVEHDRQDRRSDL